MGGAGRQVLCSLLLKILWNSNLTTTFFCFKPCTFRLVNEKLKKVNILLFTFTFSKRARIFSLAVTGSVHVMLCKAYIASDLIETASDTFSTCVVLQYFPSPLASTNLSGFKCWKYCESSPWLEKTLFWFVIFFMRGLWVLAFLFQKQPKQRSNSFPP